MATFVKIVGELDKVHGISGGLLLLRNRKRIEVPFWFSRSSANRIVEVIPFNVAVMVPTIDCNQGTAVILVIYG
jgi:hypothetical protein